MSVDSTFMLHDILVDLLNRRKLGEFDSTVHAGYVREYLPQLDLSAAMSPYNVAQGTEYPYLHNPEPFVQKVYKGLLSVYGLQDQYLVKDLGQF